MADLVELTSALAAALSEVLEADEFDLVADETGALEAMTDTWTLRVEGWPGGIAYLTIDDEPAAADELRAARRVAMSLDVERALAIADGAMGGALTVALRASGDPLSVDLAYALAEHHTDA
ncbi:MAG: hypothetical protein ACRDJH_20710 [Thermomicrobiales bacterium]